MTHALSGDYLPYIVAALIVFDMQRKMGKGLSSKYDKGVDGFAARLSATISNNRKLFLNLETQTIDKIDLNKYRTIIGSIYKNFSNNGNLDSNGHSFDVGATKILHFIHPQLFPIIDSNSASVLRDSFDISYNNTGQPGYSRTRYIESIGAIKNFVNEHGKDSLQELDAGSPITRIFDKLAFVQGAEL